MPDLKILLLDIVVICSVARALGWVFEKLHQPRVVGEMCAGILLGPSLLGWLAPPAFVLLFPPEGLASLYVLSQIGLLLFMFQVGLGLDSQELRKMGPSVVIISSSVLVPLVAGSALALYLYPRLSGAKVPLPVFALFVGTAMSITAFPVLARILEERNLLQCRVGVVAISCAAVDDITAWRLLAGLTAWVRAGKEMSPLFTLAGLAAYLFVNEHAGSDRTGDIKRRLGSGRDLTNIAFDYGDHGPGDNLHDHTGAGLVVAESLGSPPKRDPICF